MPPVEKPDLRFEKARRERIPRCPLTDVVPENQEKEKP